MIMIFFYSKKFRLDRLCVLLLMVLACHTAFAQNQPVTGNIVDATTGDPGPSKETSLDMSLHGSPNDAAIESGQSALSKTRMLPCVAVMSRFA